MGAKQFIYSLILPLLLVTTALGKDINLDWDINYVNASPDGRHERAVIGCNGKFPFDEVEGNYGDMLYINVHNSLNMTTSLHSHGIFFRGYNEFDGAPGITECGIPPGENYTYTIPLKQWGTYWIHSHSGAQYVDGWRAPLIIHPPKDNNPFDYDDEYTLTLSDWFYDKATDLSDKFLSLQNPAGGEPGPDSALFNEMVSPNIKFEPGKTYRLRIINFSAASMFYFLIDGHDMKIIEVDGVDVEPTDASTVMLAAAQRYSVLVTAKNTTDTNYLIHADINVELLNTIKPSLKPNLTATIVYDDNVDTAPGGDRFWEAYDDVDLQPIVHETFNEPDQTLDLTITFNQLDDGIFYGMFNGITYKKPKVPTLLTMLTTGEDSINTAIYGKMTNTHVFDHNQTIQIILRNGDVDPHPFHLHGHTFQVLARGKDMNDLDMANLPDNPNPMRRDTMVLPSGGYAVLRFLADNTGGWLFHCHNEWHMIAGLAAVFVVDPLGAQKNLTVPDTMKSFCPRSNFQIEGNAAGHQGTDMDGDTDGPHAINYSITGRGIGALAGCIISALLGSAAVIWYSLSDPALIPKSTSGSTVVLADNKNDDTASAEDIRN